MKKKIYKVLGIVLTMAIVLSACLCALTVAHADVTEGDITYPAFSQGNIYEKDGAAVVQTTNGGRVYTETMYKVADYEKAVVASPYQANFFFYDAAGNYVKNVGYQSAAEVKIASLAGDAAQFRVVLKDTTNNDVCTASALASDVVALYKAEQDVTVDGVTTPVMIQANILSAQGGKVQTDSTNRIATKSQFEVAKYETIKIADGYRMVVHFWGEDGSYIGETGWQTGTKTVSALPNAATAKYFRIVAGDSANSNPFAPADFPAGTLTLVQFPEGYEPPVTEDVLKDGILYPYMAPGTVNGSPYTLTTCVGAHATRLYTVTDFLVADIDTMTVAADCRAFVQFFNEDGSYNGGNGWLGTGTYTIATMSPAKNGAKYFKVTFSSTKGGNDVETPPTDGLTFTLIPKDVVDGTTVTPALVSGTINGAPNKVDTCLGTHATRLATYNTYEIADYETITTSEGVEIFVQFFMEDGSYTSVGAGSGWLTAGTYKVANLTGAAGAKYFRITYDSSPRGSVPTPGLMTFKLHAYGEYVAKDAATCTSNATEIAACECGATVTREVADTKLDHTYENYTYNEDATCTANGTETGKCECGAEDVREAADTKLDHTYENYTYNEDATCTANGTETGKCECGAEDVREAADTKLDHTYENYTYNEDATCTANGTETGKCECGAEDVREAADTKLDHTYENYTYNEDATCTANGTETGKCECGAEDVREAADTKLDHTYENYTYNEDATCTANGTETGKCECGAEDVREAVDTIIPHTFKDYASNNDAACEVDGTLTGKCECGAEDTIIDVGSALEHVWKRPTCTEPKTCETCGDTVGEPFGHDYDTSYDKDCNVCGDVREAAAITDIEIRDGKVYIEGKTSIRGLFCIDGEYYFADWGGVIKTDGTYYVKTSYCDLAGGKNYLFDAEGKMVHEEIIDGILYIHGRTATKGIYKIDGEYYFSNWGGVIEGGLKTTSYVENCDLPAGTYRFDENGKMLDNALYIDENGVKYIYVKGRTCVPGLYEIDGTLYAATWGGVVRTDGRYFVKNSYCDEEANCYFYCDADGVAEAI